MHVLTNIYFLNNKNHNWCARGSLGYFLRYIAQFPILGISPRVCWGSQIALVVKNLPANAGDTRDVRSIPGLGRSPGVGNGNLLRYSCLESPMEKGARQAIVHRVTNSQTWLMWQRIQGDLDILLLIQPFYPFTAGLPFYFQVQTVNPSQCICTIPLELNLSVDIPN